MENKNNVFLQLAGYPMVPFVATCRFPNQRIALAITRMRPNRLWLNQPTVVIHKKS